MKKYIILPIALLLSMNSWSGDTLVTPADMSDQAQKKMFEHNSNYNKCMMQSRLQISSNGKKVQKVANDILASCESHLEVLKAHLLENKVGEGLAVGMIKKMRSRAARDLMTKNMNQMAAQAAAVVNAEKIKAEKAAGQ